MTSDYVSWVLGLQGWERAWDEDSYMAGEEDVLYMDEDAAEPSPTANSRSTCDIGCQTPNDWLKSEPAQERKQAEPGRAPPLERALSIGTTSPHAPDSPSFGRWPSLNPN